MVPSGAGEFREFGGSTSYRAIAPGSLSDKVCVCVFQNSVCFVCAYECVCVFAHIVCSLHLIRLLKVSRLYGMKERKKGRRELMA